MAITVNSQRNPGPNVVGSKVREATIITSGYTSGPTRYQIRPRKNPQDLKVLIDLSSIENYSHKTIANLISINTSQLKIILKNKTKYEVRVKNGIAWSDWFPFTTRDKKYSTPDAIQQLSDDVDTTVAKHGSVLYKITNNALANVAKTHRGALVTVTTLQSSFVKTHRGAVVTNLDTKIVKTRRGATITVN